MTQKLSQEEINLVNEIQQSWEKSILDIGKTEMDINDLKEQLNSVELQKKLLLEDYNKLKIRESEFKMDLFNKYGEGEINLKTYEITTSLK